MLPDKVKVAGIDYTVIEAEYVEINGNRNYDGKCSHKEAEIHVLAELSHDRKQQVFIHELIHAMLNEAGFSDHDEDMVERLGIVMHQVLRDNHIVIGSPYKPFMAMCETHPNTPGDE